jgi:hypothetical protein
MLIDVELEEWVGERDGGAVTRERGPHYRRKPVSEFQDRPARLTPRQAVFCRNLITLAVATNNEIPVDFEFPNGQSVYLDRGCIKIAERAGFIERLANGDSGAVESIRLRWQREE